jgi:hypothetical protein
MYNGYMTYNYPLKLNFRLIALAPKISIKDASDTEILYVEQKVLALKEAVKVFNNAKDKKLLYTMQANQIIDFGATYIFRDTKSNDEIGSIQQEGMRSLFQASYTVMDKNKKQVYNIVQSNPMIALLDSLLSIIPFAELFTGFILNPTYTISKTDSKKSVLTMKKKPSFFESNFVLTKDTNILEKDETLLLLASLMIVQLEKNRG